MFFTVLGRTFINRMSIVFEVMVMLAQASRNVLGFFGAGSVPVRLVLFKQIYFTGLQALAIIISIAAILGTVIIAQVVSLVGANGPLAGKILVWTILRELAPLLTAMVVIARSGTAIATELGYMRINGEIDAIEMMGIPADRYLLLPRLCGVTVAVVVLSVYFVLTAFTGGFLVASLGWHIPYDQFFQGILASLGAKEVVLLFAKSALFGLFVSAACCCYGLSVRKSATEVPQMSTRAVITSLFAVFLLDGLITYLFSLAPF